MEFPYPQEEHKTRVMLNDPVALAYEWIKAYTENLNAMIDEEEDSPVSVEELIEIGLENAKDPYNGEYLSRGGAFEGVSLDPTFWDKLAQFKGITIPQEHRGSFFTCSC